VRRSRSQVSVSIVCTSLTLLSLFCGPALLCAAPPFDPPDPNPTIVFSHFSPDRPIRLIAYGDMRFTNPNVTRGTNPRVRQWLAERIGVEDPEVLLLTGDMPFVGSRDADWDEFQKETASWRTKQILQLPTIGNHEIYGGADQGIANYLKAFPSIQGHRYYTALIGNVEVISLDCAAGASGATPQGQWFAAQLAHMPTQVQLIFILYHTPWVVDRQSQMMINLPTKEALNLRGILETYLPRLSARVVVFNGHIHNYERFERNNVEYVVSGGGGAEPYPLLYRGKADLYRDIGFPVYHYLTLEVNDHELHAVMWKVKDPDASQLSVEQKDEFTLHLSPPVAAPKSPAKNLRK
jgi:hypothetical protein